MCGSAGGHHVSPACVPRLQVGPEDEGACCAIGSGDQGAGGVIISMEQGSLKVVISIYVSKLIKYSNFSRFHKKLGPFYKKKLRCDKFCNWSISTKNALNNQTPSSMKIYMYIVWNGFLSIADFETTAGVKTSLLPSKDDEFHENLHFL